MLQTQGGKCNIEFYTDQKPSGALVVIIDIRKSEGIQSWVT
jgi:hypothetical protein